MSNQYDVVIIGGGIVGLSILHSALIAGYDAVLLERNPDLCDGASGRNSGILCTGVDAPLGSLERALIRDSISRIRHFCKEHNVPMRECGSLICLWPWDDNDEAKLNEVLHESQMAGIIFGHQERGR
jgi:glycerol-3-phosphate dehydrogenase